VIDALDELLELMQVKGEVWMLEPPEVPEAYHVSGETNIIRKKDVVVNVGCRTGTSSKIM